MKKITFLLSFVCTLSLINPCLSSLLDEKDLDQDCYVAVRVWNNKVKNGRSVGHASLELVENGTQQLYVSLYPSMLVVNTLAGSVPPKWHTLTDDENGGKADTIVRLYSLKRQLVDDGYQKDKNKYSYTLPGNGYGSTFRDDWYSKNCAVLVRDLLNHGGTEELFQQSLSLSRFANAAPGALWTTVGTTAGIASGVVGAGIGAVKGILTLKNPLKEAEDSAKKASIAISSPFLHFASRNFSKINYGHAAGKSTTVTPDNMLNFAKDARRLEKVLFPTTESWQDGSVLEQVNKTYLRLQL